MARQTSDREDLLNEATALVVRAEFTAGGFAENILVGFRNNDAASVYIGPDLAYHFTSDNQLRRAIRDGLLIKAVDGRLFEMRRQRADGEVQLLRRELPPDETAEYLANCRQQLHQINKRITANDIELVGQSPADGDAMRKIAAWLESLPDEIAIAEKPNVV